MVGFFATADPSQPLRTDLDNELEGVPPPIRSYVASLQPPLSDARWYTRDEILAVLRHPTGATLTRRDNQELAKIEAGADKAAGSGGDGAGALAHSDPSIRAQQTGRPDPAQAPSASAGEPPFRVPPLTAIAGVLISEWAHERIGPGVGRAEPIKGNL
jgi:NAD+ diphosphatase